MQMKGQLTMTVWLVVALTVSMASSASTWIDDENWSLRSWAAGESYLVDKFHEKKLASTFPQTGEKFHAEAIAVVVPLSYTETLTNVTSLISSQFGVNSSNAFRNVDLSDAWSAIPGQDNVVQRAAKRIWGEKLAELSINTRGLDATKIRTKPYNQAVEREAYSEAKFLILNGEQLFGKECAVVVGYRTDHVKQWGMRTIHELFSFRYELRVIHTSTSTEARLFEALTQSAKGKIVMHLLPYAHSWFEDSLLWSNLKKACERNI